MNSLFNTKKIRYSLSNNIHNNKISYESYLFFISIFLYLLFSARALLFNDCTIVLFPEHSWLRWKHSELFLFQLFLSFLFCKKKRCTFFNIVHLTIGEKQFWNVLLWIHFVIVTKCIFCDFFSNIFVHDTYSTFTLFSSLIIQIDKITRQVDFVATNFILLFNYKYNIAIRRTNYSFWWNMFCFYV